jgi:hypothetical protein
MAIWRCLIETLGAVVTIVFLSLTVTIPAISAAAPPPAPANTNHTVGDKAGWFFNTSSNAPSANYSDWAASRTFYLGDFLSNVFIHQIYLPPLMFSLFQFLLHSIGICHLVR